ncbi:hypothetical protein HJG60_008983 [Phyllostomus discolor]|uniref:Uncharacterized protein n=1 Tax=Phyllostomus discolor TaxID=89673 RepID=A0A834DCM3_9CHIR|nr:hypothetical protein HJG60_008983 [Phyllostomus discolor]
MPLLFLNSSSHPVLALNESLSALGPGLSFRRSVCGIFAVSNIIASKMLPPANCFLFIQISNSFPTSSIAHDCCFVSTFTPLVTSALLMASVCFKIVLINVATPYSVASSDRQTLLSYFAVISF